MRIQLWNYMNTGWVAFDDVSVAGSTPNTKYYYGGQRLALRHGDVVYSVDRNQEGTGTIISILNPRRCLITSHNQSRQRARGKSRWST